MFRATYKCTKDDPSCPSLGFQIEMNSGDFPTTNLRNSLTGFQEVLNDKITELIVSNPDKNAHLKNESDEESGDESDQDEQEESSPNKKVKV